MSDRSQRDGAGVKWESREETCYGTRVLRGYSIDNLDSKEMKDAENSYETLFLIIRGALEKKESFCLDNESERLQVCQLITDSVHRDYRKILREEFINELPKL